jgi:hypothetical protein
MPERDPTEDPKKKTDKPPPRKAEPDDKHETQERARLDPLADEIPSICRGID